MSVRGRREAWSWVKAMVGWVVFLLVLAEGMALAEVDEARRKTMMMP